MKRTTYYGWAVLILCTAFLLGCTLWLFGRSLPSHGWQIRTERSDAPPAETSQSDTRADGLLEGEIINLNTATRSDLLRLPNIGPTRAESILAYREAHGPFRSVDQLLHVPGIGPATLEPLRPFLCAD